MEKTILSTHATRTHATRTHAQTHMYAHARTHHSKYTVGSSLVPRPTSQLRMDYITATQVVAVM